MCLISFSLMSPIRLCSVSGHDGRINDVVFSPPVVRTSDQSTVVFFGGDVQDFPEVMESHRDNKNYLKWNLENMAISLSNNYPKSNIVIIRPSRMEFKTFSCYDNFVPSNNAGVPDHTPTHYALQHLERLLQGVTHRLKVMPTPELLSCLSSIPAHDEMDIDVLQETNCSMNTSILQRQLECNKGSNNLAADSRRNNETHYSSETGVIQTPHGQSTHVTKSQSCNESDLEERNKEFKDNNLLWWRDNLGLDKASITLIGFSKGCVVLNQLIYEFHYLKTLTPDDITMMQFVSRIDNMYWLDGGHAGGKNTWITSRSLLETLTRLGVNIYVHVTPYQIYDERRPWIGREERAFVCLLRRLGAQVFRFLHQEAGVQPTLHTHFEILSTFKDIQSTTELHNSTVETTEEES